MLDTTTPQFEQLLDDALDACLRFPNVVSVEDKRYVSILARSHERGNLFLTPWAQELLEDTAAWVRDV